MRTRTLAALLALAATTPALAAPVTRTVSVDKPKYEGTRTIVRDKEVGTLTRDADVTRKSDGATAERHYARTRTDTGFTASGDSSNFAGQTRSFDVTHSRTDTGGTTNGTYTDRGGETYTLAGQRTKTETGHIGNRHITNGAGETLYNRDASVSRANGQVTRSVDVTRAQGFHPPRALRAGAGRRH
jgi:hypothetical protein